MLKVWLWNSLCLPCFFVLDQFLAEPLSEAAYRYGIRNTTVSASFEGRWDQFVAGALFAGLFFSGIQFAATWFSLFVLFKRRRSANRLCFRCMAWAVGPGFCLAVALCILCGFAVFNMEYLPLVIICPLAGLYVLRFKASYMASRATAIIPLCRGCGYSLYGLESKRCPECGLE